MSDSFDLTTKGGTVVEIFPTAPLKELAQAAKVVRRAGGSDYVFSSGYSGSVQSLYRTFKRIVARAGFPALTPHNMRHTFATTLGRNAPLSVVAELMGHKNISTTALYVHPGRNDLRAAMDKASHGWS